MIEVPCWGCVALGLFVVALLYLAYSGLFYPIVFRAAKPPHICNKLSIFYKIHVGPYSNVGSLFGEAIKLLPSCDDGTTLGIYYDDPKTVKSENCRSVVAAVVGENDSPVDANVKQRYLQAGYKQYELPAVSRAVFCYFPFKGFASILISVFRVYPKLEQFILSNNLKAFPCLEVYHKQQIAFISPLEHHKAFYAPGIEFTEEE